MALFSRIFQNRKSNKAPTTKWYTSEQKTGWTKPEFSSSQVRLVLYRDQDFKGRSLLFDSKAVHLAEDQNEKSEKKNPGRFVSHIAKPSTQEDVGPGGQPLPKYTFSRPGSDTKMLEEMVFGAVGMAFRGSTLKVHTIRTPLQLMVTKVFVPTLNRTRESGVDGESLDYSLNCSSTDLATPQKISGSGQANPSIAQSVPMDVPSPPNRGYADPEPEDSGFSTSAASSLSSLTASIPRSSSSSSINSNSYNSMTRRWRRNQQTSLEHSLLKRQSDEGVYEQPLPPTKRPAKVGMAIVISLEEDNEEAARLFQNFFFSHVTLIEGHMNKLKLGVERAMSNRKVFVHLMVEALETFRQLLADLYLTPRLPDPVWLNMMCYTTRRVSLCQRFLREFMLAVGKYDTKQTKFFLSTLITGVLTNHLAWVPTVTPAGATPSRSYLDKHSAKWLDAVAKSHPYNPLWAQLGDLYGAVGFPLRQARTLVVGKKADMVNKFLYILSYFIRCSEVLEKTQQPYEFEDVELDSLDLESDRPLSDGASQSSVFGGDSCSCMCSPAHGPEPLLQTACAQCQANRAVVSPEGSGSTSSFQPGSRSETPPVGLSSGKLGSPLVHSDVARVKLKHGSSAGGGSRESVVLASEEEDPGGGGRVSAWIESPLNQFDRVVISTEQVLAQEQQERQQQQQINCLEQQQQQQINCLDQQQQQINCLEQTEAHQVSEASVESELSAEVDLLSAKTELNTEPEPASQTLCRMSPTGVREDPDTVRIRHVGQASLLFVCPSISSGLLPGTDIPSQKAELDEQEQDATPTTPTSCDTNPKGEQLAALPEICDTDKDFVQGDEGPETKCEYSHDSGMYDTIVSTSPQPQHVDPESHPVPPLQPRDSGLSVSSHPPLSPDASTPTHQPIQEFPESSQLQEMHEEKNTKKESLYRVPPHFQHSNSMFDEYFSEETEEHESQVARELPKRSKSDAERFKRMASIEGSSSIFDEYMSVPCPDTSRISEVSNLSCTSPRDTSIFDEYFSCDSPAQEQVSLTLSLESHLSEDREARDSQRSHLADRRKATRPETLVMKAGKKEEDRTTPRHRQMSGQSTATLTPARTRSVTPTELNRRRHASSLSNASSIEADFFLNLKEVDMPACDQCDDSGGAQSFQRSFGRSLLAGFSPRYLSDFVLHGTSDTNFQGALHTDLTMSVQNSVLDEQISEVCCLIADVDNWTVKLQKCHYDTADRVKTNEVAASPLICNIIESVHSLWKLKMSPEFCLMHLEDRLQEIFFKSRTLAEYIRLHKRIDIKQLATILKFDVNDIPLLMAVAGTHTPQLSMALL